MSQPNEDSPEPTTFRASDPIEAGEAPAEADNGDAPEEPRVGPPSVPPPGFPPPGVDTLPSVMPEALGRRRGSPVLGASLWIFGALLWAYVVMGEWVIHLSLPEGLAVLIVAIAYGLAWVTSGRGLGEGAGRWKVVVPGIAALVLFFVILLLVAGLFGSGRRSTVAAVTVCLWFFSAAVYVLGRHLRARPRVTRSRWQAAGTIVLWIVSGLMTLVSLIATLARA